MEWSTRRKFSLRPRAGQSSRTETRWSSALKLLAAHVEDHQSLYGKAVIEKLTPQQIDDLIEFALSL